MILVTATAERDIQIRNHVSTSYPRTTKITLDGELREKITIMLKIKKLSKLF